MKAKKLLDSANQLAESKECDPQEIRQKQTNLELEVKTFTSKLKKRRELLKMAVSFYKNVTKVSLHFICDNFKLNLWNEMSAKMTM